METKMIPTATKNCSSEDELLEAQHQFFQSKKSQSQRTNEEKTTTNDIDLRLDVEQSAAVVGEVIEKNIGMDKFHFRTSEEAVGKTEKIGAQLSTKTSERKSLFAQKMRQNRGGAKLSGASSNVQKVDGSSIHEENVQKLANMSEGEILEQQKALIEKLDPKTVEFLRTRGKNKDNEPKQNQKCIETAAKKTTVQLDTEIESLSKSGYIHMDKLEKEKLLWTKSLNVDHQNQTIVERQEPLSARFDFNGKLLPRSAKIHFREGYHHHGQEPEAPGYTLDELFPLIRSSATNQRVFALKVLAKILENAKLGLFDSSLEPALLPKILCQEDLALATLIRHSVDDCVESVYCGSIGALAAVLGNPADEACLDRGLSWFGGVIQPFLAPRQKDQVDAIEDLLVKNSEETEHSDEEVCREDFVQGLLNMHILDRIRYILEILRPKLKSALTNSINILVRVARHSKWANQQIWLCPGLIDTLVLNFFPDDLSKTVGCATDKDNQLNYPDYGLPYWGAVKLLRLMAASDREIAQCLQSAHSVAPSLSVDCGMLSIVDSFCMLRHVYRHFETSSTPSTMAIRASHLRKRRLKPRNDLKDVFHVILSHFRAACKIDIERYGQTRQFTWDRLSACACLMEKVLLLHREKMSEREMAGLKEAVISTLGHILHGLCRITQEPNESLIDALCSLLSCYGALCESVESFKVEATLEKVLDKFFEDWIAPRLSGLKKRKQSNKEQFRRDPKNLPGLCATTKNGEKLHFCFRKTCLYPVLNCWCNFLWRTSGKSQVMLKLQLDLLQNSDVEIFLTNFDQSPPSAELSVDWLRKSEIYAVLWLCLLDVDKKDTHRDLVGKCLSNLNEGQESVALFVLENFWAKSSDKSFKWVLSKKQLDNSTMQSKIMGFPVVETYGKANKINDLNSLCQNLNILQLEV